MARTPGASAGIAGRIRGGIRVTSARVGSDPTTDGERCLAHGPHGRIPCRIDPADPARCARRGRPSTRSDAAAWRRTRRNGSRIDPRARSSAGAPGKPGTPRPVGVRRAGHRDARPGARAANRVRGDRATSAQPCCHPVAASSPSPARMPSRGEETSWRSEAGVAAWPVGGVSIDARSCVCGTGPRERGPRIGHRCDSVCWGHHSTRARDGIVNAP